MNEELIEKYAELIVRVGANVQKGQYVIIRTGVFEEDFAALVSRKCYEAGAKRVFVRWQSSKVDQVDYIYGHEDDLKHVLPFEEYEQKFTQDEYPILIWLDGDDPDGLKGVDANKVARIRQARYLVLGKYREASENHHTWVIAGVPSLPWAKKVFPDLPADQAMEKLWEAILKTSRADDGNGIENWKKHDEDLKMRCRYLDSLNLKKLHYRSKNGTDLTVGLIPGVHFAGGNEKTLEGQVYSPNIPSEECFTSPRKGEAEGIVYATKPLSYQGQLIENFYVRFHEGKAVEAHAETGEEALLSILSLDQGSSYLGECAFVPYHSPINDTGLLFFNTLFDENASCHLALGTGFPELYPDYANHTDEEIRNAGINKSQSHVDFMIGSEDMEIIGTTRDGKEVPIFKNGDWAF